MNESIIETNSYLNRETRAFFHTSFFGYGQPGNPDFLNVLKNDNHHNWSNERLIDAQNQLKSILKNDLPKIKGVLRLDSMTVCVAPRAKAEESYSENQLLFMTTIRASIREIGGFEDGTSYIRRHTNTKTTHLRKPIPNYQNDGSEPYPGIASETCHISSNVKGKNILLIDDIYTPTVNIDEDAIQSIINKGAHTVTFYAVAKTERRNGS